MFNNGGGYSIADIAAVTGGNRSSGDGAWGDNGAWWIIILFLFCFAGWGNGGWAGGMGGGTSGALTRADLCQDMNFAELSAGVRNVNDAVSLGFSNLNSTICHQQYDTAGLINGIGMNMMQGFNNANVVALTNQNALQTQVAQCCCDAQRSMDRIDYNMATNTCAITNTMNTNTRDIIDNQNAGTRAILDYLCQDKIASLTAENQTLKFAASQSAQNAFLINALNPAPVPAYAVPNPYTGTYGYGSSCGCGCYGGSALVA